MVVRLGPKWEPNRLRAYTAFMLLRCFTVLLVLASFGCAGTPAPRTDASGLDPYGSVPGDFSLDVTILAAEDEPRADRRNARYVVFPDGSMYHEAVVGRGPNTLPAFTRRLSPAQLAALWSTVRTLGLADAGGADEVANFRRVIAPKSGHAYLVAVTADDAYWNYTRAVAPGEQLEPALRSLLRELATLAWADDEFNDRRMAAPVRYDFGPDPWAAYRQNEEQ